MLDMIEIRINFDSSLVDTYENGRYGMVGVDYNELEIPLGAKSIHYREDGTIGTDGIYNPWGSIPTSFTGLACKVHLDGYFFPHVIIKGSPAKLLQGHNVFGTDNLQVCIEEMFYWLQEAYPTLYGMLSIQTAEIRRLDVTYMSHVSNSKHVRQAIDFMSRISNGQTKPTKNKKYETTVYWGGATSRLIRQKCYAKHEEFQAQLSEYRKKAKQGDKTALPIIQAMSDERVLEFSKNSLRWECTLLARWLERNDIPINAWQMIEYQQANPEFLQKAWKKGFIKIFDAIQGMEMKVVNDDKVLARLKKEYGKPLKSGKYSYRKAINLFGFYTQLKAMGYAEVKAQELYSISQFNRLVADLIAIGLSRAYIQNLSVDSNSNVIPFVQIINVDFSKQLPDWYEEPISTPQKLAKVA